MKPELLAELALWASQYPEWSPATRFVVATAITGQLSPAAVTLARRADWELQVVRMVAGANPMRLADLADLAREEALALVSHELRRYGIRLVNTADAIPQGGAS